MFAVKTKQQVYETTTYNETGTFEPTNKDQSCRENNTGLEGPNNVLTEDPSSTN